MQRRSIFILIVLLTLVLATGLVWLFIPSLFSAQSSAEPIDHSGSYAVWQQGERCFTLEVADTLARRRQGLSGRPPLEENMGMLFLYDLQGEYGFWMKDMNFAIDIIWLDRDDEVVTIESRVSPNSYPHVFYPRTFAKKVIEVSAGVAEELDIKVGDKLRLSAPTTTSSIDCAIL